MPVMEKKKPKSGASSTPPKRVRTGYSLNVWIDQQLGEALDEALASIQPRTSKTALMEMLLAQYLTERGLWPRKGGA